MNEVAIATLTLIRNAILGTLPVNSPEILRQIPHPVPGYFEPAPAIKKFVDKAHWSVPDDQKILSPAIMNPFYDSSSAKSVSFDTSIKGLNSQFSKAKIAVVSLKNLYSPVRGLLRGDENAPAASTAKIAGLYSLFQLYYEMSKLVREKSITTITELQQEANQIWLAAGFTQNAAKNRLPDLKKIFDFYPGSQNHVNIYTSQTTEIVDYFDHFDPTKKKLFFTKEILEVIWYKTPSTGDHTIGFSRGNVGGKLIKYIGYAYVGSVMLCSGLFVAGGTDTPKGMWIKNNYLKEGNWPASENPFKSLPFVQNITASSVADFFTLMKQGRIVNPAVSAEIDEILDEGGCISFFDDISNIGASKCGYIDEFGISNEAIVVEDPDPLVGNYVVVVLTQNTALRDKLENNQASFFNQIKNMIKML